jgi:phosphoserine phosphatase
MVMQHHGLPILPDDLPFLHPLDRHVGFIQGHAAELLCQPDDSFETKNLQHNKGLSTIAPPRRDKQLEVNIVPYDRRRKQILIADMDDTIIPSESLDDLAALAGLADAVTAITKRAMAGEIDFEGALFERVRHACWQIQSPV